MTQLEQAQIKEREAYEEWQKAYKWSLSCKEKFLDAKRKAMQAFEATAKRMGV